MTTKRHREKGIVGRELLQGLLLERKTVPPNPHLTPPKLQDPRRRSRKGQRKRALRVPNFGCLRQRPLAPTVGNETPEPAPPLRLPRRGPLPPSQHRPGRQEGLGPGTAAVGAPPPAGSRSPGPARSLRPRRAPSPGPPPPSLRLGTAPGSGPRGGRAPRSQVGAPAKSAGLAGFSLHTGDASAARPGRGGRCRRLRPSTAPHTGRGWPEGGAP